MKKAHKLISAVLVSTMVLSMTACGSGEKTYKVGILQQLSIRHWIRQHRDFRMP